MRFTYFLAALVSSLVLTACQSSDDETALVLNNNAADDNLNLDPVLDETKGSAGSSTDEPNVTPCLTEDGADGLCVSYYLCDQESKTIIEDGYTLIDVRITSCPKLLEVCCRRNQVMAKKPRTTTPAPIRAESSDDKTNFDIFLPTKADQGKILGKCGISNPGISLLSDSVRIDDTPDNKIYADFGEYPWMVAILKRNADEAKWEQSNYIGGGTLIHPMVVMTVAHKVKGMKPEDLKIRAGEYETNTLDEEYDHQEQNVAKIVIHQNYFRPSLYNDIALLFLENPVVMNDTFPNIGLACLGRRLPPANTTCFSMGWGATNFNNKNVFASILKKVKLPLLDGMDCQSKLQRTRLGPTFKLHQSLLCAGGEQGVDTCRGDGGASLVCPLKPGGTRYAVYGMVAYGLACGEKDVPGVYVNIPALYDWVTQQITAEGYDERAYKLA